MNPRNLLGALGGAVTAMVLGHAATACASPPPGRPPAAVSARAGSAFSVAGEEARARSRLPVTLRQPHAGVPEVLTHPSADVLGGAHVVAASPRLATPMTAAGGVYGVDVSSYQGDVRWRLVARRGAQFAYVKATEGTYYADGAFFAEQYGGSHRAGLVRGAYHFAIPDNSSGAAQADFFVANGGGWAPRTGTLPGMLDLEFNPYGQECYGLDPRQLVRWLTSFDGEYRSLTGRYPVLYTNTSWWDTCIGGAGVAPVDPLAVANYGASPYPLPPAWSVYTVWQYTDDNVDGFDGDVFDGDRSRLLALAGTPPRAPVTNRLVSGQRLVAGHSIVSDDRRYVVAMSGSGDLVERTASGATVWSSRTSGHPGASAVMEADGDLVVDAPGGRTLWASRTAWAGRSQAVVRDDGDLVIYASGGRITWSDRR